jgi:hypothetical protein
MKNKKTHEEFMKEFEEKQPELFNKIEIIGKYVNKRTKIEIKTSHGNIYVYPRKILEGSYPKITSVENKTAYFIKELELRNIKKYNVVKYINSKKVIMKDEYGYVNLPVADIYKRKNTSICSAIDKHLYFIELMKYKVPNIYNEITILSKYNKMKGLIFVENKYGIMETTPGDLLSGKMPSFESAVDKHEYFMEVLRLKRPDIYYNFEIKQRVSLLKKAIIIKNEYGYLRMIPSEILNSNKTPTIKAAICKTNYAINHFRKIHGFKYDYSSYNYILAEHKIGAVCRDCGHILESNYSGHIAGKGCDACVKRINRYKRSGFIKSSRGRESICYIIKCWNDEEEFYKVGITSLNLYKRFDCRKRMPYQYSEIHIFKGSPGKVWDIEKQIHEFNKKNEYIPKMYFEGITECFKKVDIDIIVEKRLI